MKPRSLRLAILACAWMILGSATPAHDSKVSNVKQTQYYWYWSDSDIFMEHSTTAQAISDLEAMTGRSVSTAPAGGTLLANGYSNNDNPHTLWPAVKLYEH